MLRQRRDNGTLPFQRASDRRGNFASSHTVSAAHFYLAANAHHHFGIDGSRPCHWSLPGSSAGQFVTAIELFRVAWYDYFHEIPRLQQVMPTASLIRHQCMEDTGWV